MAQIPTLAPAANGVRDRLADAALAPLGGPLDAVLARAAEPLTITVELATRRVTVADRGSVSEYEPARPGDWSSLRWREIQRFPDGTATATRSRADEVMAVARDADREEDVAALTLAIAAEAREHGGVAGAAAARRLEAEVRRGRELQRVSVRAFQERLLERLVAGDSLSLLCERGGFLDAGGRVDTSWLLRRLGLAPLVCSRTGKLRCARTLRYDVAVRVAAALDCDPVEMGV